MDLSLLDIVILAIVQGLTEFLPISSSGHVVILAEILGSSDGIVDLNIVLHAGTLLSILVYYHRTILQLLGDDRRVIGLLILATIPAVIVGLPLMIFCENLLDSALLAGALLPVTGLVLLWTKRLPEGKAEYREMSLSTAIRIGIVQSLAILPGISRSGTTIAAGMKEGLQRPSAATFSFLIAIPALCGAIVLKVPKLISPEENMPTTDPRYLVIGFFVAFLVGLGSLSWLVRLLNRGRFHYFAWWCIPLGIAVVLWQLIERFS